MKLSERFKEDKKREIPPGINKKCGSSTLQVSMLDTPFLLSGQTVTAVNLGIEEVEVIGNGQGTSGVKINLSPHLNAVSGGVYAFTLDFNAQESILLANGQYIMKPVIAASATNIAGSLSGAVLNQSGGDVSNALVEAEQNGAVINTGVTDTSGNFTINSLPAGTYNIVVLNQYTTQAGTSETASGYDNTVGATLNVSGSFTVTAGSTTSVGNITD